MRYREGITLHKVQTNKGPKKVHTVLCTHNIEANCGTSAAEPIVRLSAPRTEIGTTQTL